jgi:NTE family protein
MIRADDILELNNLRLGFSAIGLLGELRDELRRNLRFAATAARALLPPAALRGRRGPPADGIFPPFAPRALPALAGKRVGILASGGAGATASLVGVQRALEEAGIVPAAIAACSGAALFTSLWAAGLTADEVARFWLGLRDSDYIDPDWRGLARGAARRLRGWGGLLAGDALERSYWRRLGDLTLGATRIPFSAVVWNIDENRVEHVGTRQTPDLPLARAARVAVAIPILYPPVTIDGRRYGDGGIVDIFPSGPLLEVTPPLDVVLGVNLYSPEEFLGEDVTGFMDEPWSIIQASGQLRWAGHLELARARARELGDRLLLLHPVPYRETRGMRFYGGFMDRSDWPRAMRRGYDVARAALDRFAETRPTRTPLRAVRREPIDLVDAAWLRLEQPRRPMTVTTALLADAPFERAPLVAAAERLVAATPRLWQRFEDDGYDGPAWLPLASLDVGAQVARARLPAPGGDAELAALLGQLASSPLDRGAPLWRIDAVEGHGDGGAAVLRLHQAIAGNCLARSLQALGGAAAALPPPRPPLHREELRARKAEVRAALARLFAHHEDPPTSLRAPLSGDRRLAWSPPLAAATLDELARRWQATPDDVLWAALAGALRRTFAERGERPPALTLHAAVAGPGLAFVPLPIGLADPAARIQAIARTATAPDAAAPLLALAGLGAVRPALREHLLRTFTDRATVLVVRTTGPSEPLQLAGRRVTRLLLWPAVVSSGLAVGVVRYAGAIEIAIASDASCCAEPRRLAAALAAELEALVALGARPPRLVAAS